MTHGNWSFHAYKQDWRLNSTIVWVWGSRPVRSTICYPVMAGRGSSKAWVSISVGKWTAESMEWQEHLKECYETTFHYTTRQPTLSLTSPHQPSKGQAKHCLWRVPFMCLMCWCGGEQFGGGGISSQSAAILQLLIATVHMGSFKHIVFCWVSTLSRRSVLIFKEESETQMVTQSQPHQGTAVAYRMSHYRHAANKSTGLIWL